MYNQPIHYSSWEPGRVFFLLLRHGVQLTIYFALIYVWAINHIRHRILKWKSILIDELLRLKFSRVLNFLLYINKNIYIKGLNVIIGIDQKRYEWPDYCFAKLVYSWGIILAKGQLGHSYTFWTMWFWFHALSVYGKGW